MKKTQIKDILRNIRKQRISFISVVVIALLGVSIFLGLDYSAAAMTRNGSAFFRDQRFRDLEAVSTLLFSQEDLDDMRSIEGVAEAEPVWQVSAKASSGLERADVDVISLTESINIPILVEGRLPDSDTECAAEQKLAEEMGWTIGSEIIVQNASGESVPYLNGDRFTLVGIANHPDHGNTLVAETGYILVTDSAFDHEALDGCFMKAELSIEKDADVDRFSAAYRDNVAAVQERLETLARSATTRREGEALEHAQTQIDEKQQELDRAGAELDDARTELDEGWAALSGGEQELSDARAQLEEAKQQLEDGWKQLEWSIYQLVQGKKELDAAKTELDAGAAELREAKAQLDGAKAELEDGWSALEDAKAQIRGGIREAVEAAIGNSSGSVSWAGRMPAGVDSALATAMPFWITTEYCCDLNQSLTGNINSFVYSGAITDEMLLEAYIAVTGSDAGFEADGARASLAATAAAAAGAFEGQYHSLQTACAAWDAGHAQYIDGLNEYQAGLGRYNEGLASYEAGMSRYEDGYAAYRRGLAQYNEAKAQYEQGLSDAEEGQKKLEESKKQLKDGEAAYRDALSQIAEGEQKLEQAREQLGKLDPCRWLILDGNGNPGYVQLSLGADNLHSMKGTFALLFVLVGALVIYATVSKMVDEQRNLIGTTKALGFFNREIFAKYLSFGVSATVLGAALGILFARFLMESIALGGYNLFYIFDLTKPAVTAGATLLALIAAAALAAIAVWAACSRLLRSPAIRLMQARVPQGAKKAAGGGKHALSLYSRLILLNIRSDLRRVIVTVVSVAGCCALIVIGVTLRTGLMGSLDRQFGTITDYDWRVSFAGEESEQAQEEMEALLRETGAEYAPLNLASITYQISNMQIADLFVCDVDTIQSLYHLRDWKSAETMSATDEGILIQRRVAESYDLDVGSEFEITLGGTKSAVVRVAGVFEHYVGRPMVMSEAYYEEVFGEPCTPNTLFVRLNGADAEALGSSLRAVPGFGGITRSDTDKDMFVSSTDVLNSMVLLFIFMGAVMAGVVLMNLTNMYVLQKKRELTIMRVNGFTVKETVSYLLRETYVTTALGILLGLGVGSSIAYAILRLLEQPFAQYVRSVSLPAWIAGTVLTVLFTVLVNSIALRPVKNLKLTDVS